MSEQHSTEIPVWHCTNDDCGASWAYEEEVHCPECEEPSVRAGHTLQDVESLHKEERSPNINWELADKMFGTKGTAWNIDEVKLATQMLVDPTTGAKRGDIGKLRYDLLPPKPIEQLVKILSGGAEKYGDRNWEKGMAWSRCYASAMRHLQAWYQGEDKDPESGESHLAHAMCNIVFLLEYERTNKTKDDRPGQV